MDHNMYTSFPMNPIPINNVHYIANIPQDNIKRLDEELNILKNFVRTKPIVRNAIPFIGNARMMLKH